jgi:non-ribosomal peptide synthetase component F
VNGDRLTRWTAVAAVLAVAAVAALISYRHAVDVVTAHGEPGMIGRLYPVVIDGLIIAASMVLLDAARHRERAPRLAWWMLAAGIGATLAVNVLAGVASGPLGEMIAAWPAAGFVGCYELLMLLVRASARRTAASPQGTPEGPVTVPEVVAPEVPSTAYEAARAAYIASVRGANPISERGLADRFGIPRSQARKLRAEVAAAGNGHSPGGN